jgi:hypothetical protein
MRAALGSGVHVFTVIFDGESTDTGGESRLRFRVDTASTAARSITVNVDSEDTLTVHDPDQQRLDRSSSELLTIHRTGGVVTERSVAVNFDEDSNDDTNAEDLLISWAHPTAEEAHADCSEHIRRHVAASIKIDMAWEAELKRLVNAHEQDAAALSALLEHAAIQSVPSGDLTPARLFRLRHLADTNEVFDKQPREVQTVRKYKYNDIRDSIQYLDDRIACGCRGWTI